MSASINRRSFLKGTALAGAGMAAFGIAGCSTGGTPSTSNSTTDGSTASGEEKHYSFETPPDPIDDSEITETIEADVIIIGAGVFGLVCGASLSEEGADVRLFAASSAPVSRGRSNHGIGSKVQERYGIDYNKENCIPFFKQQFARGSYRMDQKKWWRFINNDTEAINWMIDIMEGAGFETTIEVGYDDPDGTFSYKPSSHGWIGDEVTRAGREGEQLVTAQMEKMILESGNSIDYNTIAKYLVREDDNTGRVSAVIAQDADGNYKKYVGRKAIVMATGDFSGDPELMDKYCKWAVPLIDPAYTVDYNANFKFGGLFPGDGQKMGAVDWSRMAKVHTQRPYDHEPNRRRAAEFYWHTEFYRHQSE